MTIPHITDETRIVIDDITVTTFSAFAAENRDGLDGNEIEKIKRSLTETREYVGGGGAFATFKIGLAWDWNYQGPELNEHLAQLLEDQGKAEASGDRVEMTRLKGEIVRTEAMSRAFDAAINRGEGEPTQEAEDHGLNLGMR